MRNKKQTLMGFILGVLVAVGAMVLTGAVHPKTNNMVADTDHPFQNVYASNDGKTVFVCDSATVYRSTDGGANWTVVLKKGSTPAY